MNLDRLSRLEAQYEEEMSKLKSVMAEDVRYPAGSDHLERVQELRWKAQRAKKRLSSNRLNICYLNY